MTKKRRWLAAIVLSLSVMTVSGPTAWSDPGPQSSQSSPGGTERKCRALASAVEKATGDIGLAVNVYVACVENLP
jgi:hypothetical protein